MTLDTAKFISNSIKTQAKIQHLDINTKTTNEKDIPASVKKLIVDAYGEKYLDDANYVSFFWGAISKDEIKKLFNVVDKALGKSANKLTDTDFKKISLDGSSNEDIDDSTEEVEVDAKDEETSDDKQEMNEDEDSDDVELEDVDDNIEVDDDEVEVDDVEEAPSAKTTYFFLKITLK